MIKEDLSLLEGLHTPFYYYDMDALEGTLSAMKAAAQAAGIAVHYALKANCDPRILKAVRAAGFGADCISGAEITLALESGFTPEDISFAGVGKSDKGILTALKAGVSVINVESVQELLVIEHIAKKYSLKANIGIRVNPNVDTHTLRYITSGMQANKFGITETDFPRVIEILRRSDSLVFKGIHCHAGSQMDMRSQAYRRVCRKVASFCTFFEEAGLKVEVINLGGGLAVNYEDPSEMPDFEGWMDSIREIFSESGARIITEPGRSLVAGCGTLYSRVLYIKENDLKTFLVIDAGMNNLLRPALYGAYHKIENLSADARASKVPGLEEVTGENQVYEIVGPVCESSDTWGKERRMRLSVRGDLLAIRSAGAYGQVMANSYNMREPAQTVYSDKIEEAIKEEYV